MITRIDRYVARTYLSSWFLSTVFFVGFFGIIDFFQNVGEIMQAQERTGANLLLIARFYMFQMPGIYLNVAPFVMLMAALVTVMRLQRHNEFMAMSLMGRSNARVLMPVFVMTALFIGMQVYVQEAVAPKCARQRDRLESLLLEHEDEWVIKTVSLRDREQRLFQARRYKVNTEEIERLIISFTDQNGQDVRIEGRDAVHDAEAGGWRMGVASMTFVDPATHVSREEPVSFFRTDIRPADLLVDYLDPFDISYGDILEKSERYPLNRSYRLLRHYHVTYPVSVMMLVLLGLPFVLRHGVQRSGLVGLGYSLALCFAFMVLDTTSRSLGVRGLLPYPILAAWMPVIIAGSLVVVFFDTSD